jgi:hypothetical protein
MSGGRCTDALGVTMVSWVVRQSGGEGTGGRWGPYYAAHHIQTRACTLLLAGTMATVAPAAHVAVSGIKAPPGRLGPAVSRVYGGLGGVAFTSARNAWAVGATEFAQATLIEHWDGTAWKVVPSPDGSVWRRVANRNRRIMPGSWLSGVAATSATDVWAIGGRWSGDAARTLILHWDGTAWQPVASPSPGGSSGNSYVSAVAVTSPASAWAVGEYYDGTAYRGLVLHWNGDRWRQVRSPNPGPAVDLSAVAATSPASAWAVGSYCATCSGHEYQALIEHWDGTGWRRVTSPVRASDTRLFGVTASSARNAWAVGQSAAATPLILHWDGTAWQRVPSPVRTTGSALVSVAALSARDAWAVGSGPRGVIVMHWDGTTWKVAPGPTFAGGDGLGDVIALSATNAWAVGGVMDPASRTLIEHWDGTTWQRVPSP